jgi:hypothetical protein
MSVTQEETTPAATDDARVKRVALVGVGLALVMALIRSGTVTENDFGAVVWVVMAWTVGLGLVFRRGRRTLFARPELLAPVGVLLPLEVAREWLEAAPALKGMMQPFATLSLWGTGLSLSVPTLLAALIWTAFAAWQTDLLLRALTTAGPPDLSPWQPVRRGFWRAFGVLFLGAAGLQILGMPFFKLFQDGTMSSASLATFLLLLTLVYDAVTLSLLPVVLSSPAPFTEALRVGLRQGWRQKWRFLRLAFMQLGLLGALTYYSGEHGWSWKCNFHTFWVGGFECHPYWYSDQRAWLNMPTSPFVTTALRGLFLILAVAVKIEVIAPVVAKPTEVHAESSDGLEA